MELADKQLAKRNGSPTESPKKRPKRDYQAGMDIDWFDWKLDLNTGETVSAEIPKSYQIIKCFKEVTGSNTM